MPLNAWKTIAATRPASPSPMIGVLVRPDDRVVGLGETRTSAVSRMCTSRKKKMSTPVNAMRDP